MENGSAVSISTYKIGETPIGIFPGTKTSYLSAFGEVGVDFDFGQPELALTQKSPKDLEWSVYVLFGDGNVYTVNVPLDAK